MASKSSAVLVFAVSLIMAPFPEQPFYGHREFTGASYDTLATIKNTHAGKSVVRLLAK